MYCIEATDNGLHFFQRDGIKRCSGCHQLLNKWQEDLSSVPIPRKVPYDISASYDGVLVASSRFRDLALSIDEKGLVFRPLNKSLFSVWTPKRVHVDARASEIVFEKRCPICGIYQEVAGPKIVLKARERVPESGFARTDVEFGSGDEKHPVLLCGGAAARTLRKARLRGLVLVEPCFRP